MKYIVVTAALAATAVRKLQVDSRSWRAYSVIKEEGDVMMRFFAILLVAGVSFPVAHAQAVQVTFMEKVGADINRYMVKGAEGADARIAVGHARWLALREAGLSLTGSNVEKAAATRYLERPTLALMERVAHKQRIARTTWGDIGPKLDVVVDVNVTVLRKHLEAERVITSGRALAKGVGNPTIMVVFSKIANRPRTLTETQLGEVCTTYIASFMTNRRWNLVDRKARRRAKKTLRAITGVSGLPMDPVARIAMLAGADIYVEFSVVFNRNTRSASVSIKAHETATGSLRASAQANSKKYMRMRGVSVSNAELVNEALGNLMPKFFENVLGYWQLALKEGRPLSVVIKADFSNRRRYRAARDALKELGTFKRTARTQQSLTGVLRSTADPDDLSDDLIDGLEEAGIKVKVVLETRSLLVIQEGAVALPTQ